MSHRNGDRARADKKRCYDRQAASPIIRAAAFGAGTERRSESRHYFLNGWFARQRTSSAARAASTPFRTNAGSRSSRQRPWKQPRK